MMTNSEISSWRRCPRLHYYRYELGWREIEKAPALELGTAVHAGLEAWLIAFKAGRPESALESALDAIDSQGPAITGLPPLIRVQAIELMTAYHCRWADEPLEVLEVEQSFEAEVCDPILGDPMGIKLGGKLDGVIRLNGEVYVIEHKTSSADFSPGSFYWERTRLDSQIGLYFLGARALGYQPVGCLYDVIGKPRNCEPQLATPADKKRYRKDGGLYANQRESDETPSEYENRLRAAICAEPGAFFARSVVVRLKDEIDDAIYDMVNTIDLMSKARSIGAPPRNVDSCFDFGRKCEFFDVCTRQGALGNPDKFRKATKRHEELEGEKDNGQVSQ